jgi:hypothetical protein
MEKMSSPFWHSLLSGAVVIGKHSLIQFICLFGLLMVSGFLLTWISRWTNNSFRQFRFPQMGLYLFGVIGVPLHEFCHALFAKVFFHDIKSIKWFDPQGKNGSYGVVVHTYDDKNLYHRVGLFFIGMGPVLLAPFFLYLFYALLVPGSSHVLMSAATPSMALAHFAQTLMMAQNWSSVGFYVFLYICICLTSQMELSNEDFAIARGGMIPLFCVLIVMNAGAYAINLNVHAHLSAWFSKFLNFWSSFFCLALGLSLVNMILCFLFLSLINRLLGRGLINPFRNGED